MQLTTREDIEAPLDFVFAQVTDFSGFERQALRRGADVRRRDANTKAGLGATWDVTFPYRGKDRTMRAVITEYEAPTNLMIKMETGGLSGLLEVKLIALSSHRTRMTVSTDAKATGLSARLLLQSFKLAKAKVDRRLKDRVAALAQDIEDRHKRGR